MENDAIRIIIADDQASTRRALKALLAFEPRIAIIGEAGNGKDAIRLAGELQPDLILMDVHMPVLDGLKATQKIKSIWPDIKVIVYTLFPGFRIEANDAGADDFLLKGSPGLSPAQMILSFFPLEGNVHPNDTICP